MNFSLPRDVIPAKAGIQSFQILLDPGFRRGDGMANGILLKLMTLISEL